LNVSGLDGRELSREFIFGFSAFEGVGEGTEEDRQGDDRRGALLISEGGEG